jgi:sugar phosphate isomerase/epimerase
VWTILPTPFNVPGLPTDPRQRTDLICQGMRRLAPFKPAAFIIGPGVSGDANRPLPASRELADGLAQVADVGAELGVPVAFELLAVRRGSPLGTLPEIARFIDEVGKPNVGILFDIWHSWPEEDLDARIQRYGDRISACTSTTRRSTSAAISTAPIPVTGGARRRPSSPR